MKDTTFSKIKKQSPVSVIVHATNVLGKNLAKILLEQGSKVILIDKFDSKSKNLILELKKLGDLDFVDITGLSDLMTNIGRVDYLFYLQSEFLLSNQSFSSKDFLEESNNLDLCLKVAQKYNSKVSLITSISLNEKLIQTAYNKPTSYSPEELQKYSETLTAEYHDRSKINARILRVGTVLGKESNVEKFPTLKQLFEDSVLNDSINIAGEGLNVHYLIHLSDLVYGVLKLTFNSATNGEVVSLCNNNEYTTLSIAYKLLELNPNATEIKFIPNSEKRPVLHSQYVPAPNASEYGWKQKKSLEISVSETLALKYQEHKKAWEAQPLLADSYEKKLEEFRNKKLGPKPKEKAKRGHTSVVATPTGEALSKALKPIRSISLKNLLKPKALLKTALILLILLPLFYFLLYPLAAITAGGFSIYRSSSKLSENLSDFDNSTIQQELGSINRNVQGVGKSFEKLKWAFLITQQSDMYDETTMLLYGLETGSEGLVNIVEGIQPLITYMKEFEPALGFQDDSARTTREYTGVLKELETNSDKITESAYKISQSLKTIKQVNLNAFPQALRTRLEEVQNIIGMYDEQIEPIAQIVNFLPESLGVNERQRYLILLQNPGEIRSTGGWLTSYAIIGMEGGQIRELNVDDVYNLDGELKNLKKFFEPPSEMEDMLQVKILGLSLANWDPNFPETAKNSSVLVQEAGKAPKIDGVIAIDIYVLQNLLDIWDGINIPGETDVITSENIYEKVFLLHKNFTPGESQKATFLTSLADEVIKKIFSSNLNENRQVFSSFLESLESKNMLIYFKNLDAQRYFSQRNWTGEINPQKYSAFPFSIEWNWGANKANLYLEREQRVKTEITNVNEIKQEYSLILKNNSTSSIYPQGEYKNYLRVYLPEKALVSTVNGFTEGEYQTYVENGFQVLAGWFNVPLTTTKELRVIYTLEENNAFFKTEGDIISLNSKIFKQPGTSKKDLLRLEILYPTNWSLLEQDGFERARIHLIKQMELEREENVELKWTLE